MRQEQQRSLDSLHRVPDFLDTHADVLGSLKDSAERKQIDAAVADIAAHVTSQGTVGRVLAGQNSRKKALAKDLVKNHMQPIAKFACAKLRGVPEYSALSKSVQSANHKALVHAARSMAVAATPYVGAMTAAGFPADTIQQLTAATDALNEATIKRDNMKSGRVESTKKITTDLRLGREAVRVIDAVISKQFGSNEALLAGWRSARRVGAKPGAVRKPALVVPTTATTSVAQPVTVGPSTVASTIAPAASPAVSTAAPPTVQSAAPSAVSTVQPTAPATAQPTVSVASAAAPSAVPTSTPAAAAPSAPSSVSGSAQHV